MLEGTTQVIIEAIKLACNGVQHSYRYLEIRNVHVALLQLLEDIIRRVSKFNKLIRHCILHKIYQQLQTFQSQQATSHSDHTRSRPSSDLLCEDGATDFLYTRNEELIELHEVAATSSLNQLHTNID